MTKVRKNRGLKNQKMQHINDEVQKLEGQTEGAMTAIFNHYIKFRNEIENFLSDKCTSREASMDLIYKLYSSATKNLENKSKDIQILEKCIEQVDSLFGSFKETRVYFLIMI